MLKDNYEVEVLINGKPAKEYAHNSKIYIEGRIGTRFSIRMRNNSYSRKLFVPTIDGLSIMDGKEGDFNSRGYIIPGYSSITIEGWRTSDKDVASFYFSSPTDSYRKKMNMGNNLGVIGVAVFDEVSHNTFTLTNYGASGTFMPDMFTTPTYYHNATSNHPGDMCSDNTSQSLCYCSSKSSGSSPTQQLGTGCGEQKRSEVTTVSFDRVSNPDTIFEIYYNTRQGLEKAGVNLKREPLYVTPQAFPGQFCKPPKN